MKTTALKSIVISLLVTCSFTTTQSVAGDRFIQQDPAGFCTSLRLVEHETLTQHIRAGRSTLLRQQTALTQHVEKQKFSGMDTLITLVMPGGLLYAAVKHGKQLEKRQELKQLTQDIQQLTGDLLILESTSGKLQIAAFEK